MARETRKGPIYEKSFSFAIAVVRLSRQLQTTEKEFVLSKQLLRSGTAIGALVREAEHAESKADFIHKMSIALKEANETLYWLDLLDQSSFPLSGDAPTIRSDCDELVRLLVSIVKTSKRNLHET